MIPADIKPSTTSISTVKTVQASLKIRSCSTDPVCNVRRLARIDVFQNDRQDYSHAQVKGEIYPSQGQVRSSHSRKIGGRGRTELKNQKKCSQDRFAHTAPSIDGQNEYRL
jgi:hypothetical protein